MVPLHRWAGWTGSTHVKDQHRPPHGVGMVRTVTAAIRRTAGVVTPRRRWRNCFAASLQRLAAATATIDADVLLTGH